MSDRKRSAWTNEEDELLKKYFNEALEEVGKLEVFNETFEVPKNFAWMDISRKLKNRNSKQCRERFLNHLKPGINPLPWTEEEDNLLKLLHRKYPSQWKLLSTYLKGRTENNIKLRWRYFERQRKKKEKRNRVKVEKANSVA